MVLALLLIFIILIVLLLFKMHIFHPAGLFAIVWIAFCIGSIATLGSRYSFPFKGVTWILLSVLLYILPQAFFSLKYSEEKQNTSKIPNISWGMLLCFIALAFGSVVFNMVKNGILINALGSFSSLLNISHSLAVLRYSGKVSSSTIEQILNLFIYVSPLCCGYSFVYANDRKKKMVCFVSIVPVLLLVLITNAKLALIAYVILFFIGFYVSYLNKNKSYFKVKLNLKIILLGLAAAGIFFVLIYLSFLLRVGTTDIDPNIIITKIGEYAFGHIQGFDTWYSSIKANTVDYGLGINTFLAISSRLGVAEKVSGIYTFIPGSCTNVYTQFRPLIEDWGMVLSLFWILALGIITVATCNTMIQKDKANIGSQVLLSMILFWDLYFIASAWVYTSYIFIFFVFAFFIFYAYNRKTITQIESSLIYEE
jgi:oligosaccharide repeat unit polymerase